MVTSDFEVNDRPWNISNSNITLPMVEKIRANWTKYTTLNRTACINRYMSPFSGAGDVVVVTTESNNSVTRNDGTSLIYVQGFGARDWNAMPWWMCRRTGPSFDCTKENLLPDANDWRVTVTNENGTLWSVPLNRTKDVTVSYCLSEGIMDIEQWCSLEISVTIMEVVCVMNLLKLISVAIMVASATFAQKRAFSQRYKASSREPLITIGDAIESFLDNPDATTKGMCLFSQTDFEGPRGWNTTEKQWYGETVVKKFTLVSRKSWIITIVR